MEYLTNTGLENFNFIDIDDDWKIVWELKLIN